MCNKFESKMSLYSLYRHDMFLGTFIVVYGIVRHSHHNSYTLQQKHNETEIK